jgi:hypothetical protein
MLASDEVASDCASWHEPLCGHPFGHRSVKKISDAYWYRINVQEKWHDYNADVVIWER